MMVSTLLKVALPLAIVAFAAFYQLILQETLFTTYGFARHIQTVSDFPYTCRRIHDPRLQACEDMWLSPITRQLFLACSDSAARKEWMPNIGHLNASGRSLTDAVIAMEIDKPKDDGRLHLVGLTGDDGANGINLFLINAQPSVDPSTGTILDNTKIGGASTIERFVLAPPDSSELRHLKTFDHPEIATPNNIAAVGKNAFYFTNDHGPHKLGLQFALSNIIGNGEVGYCSTAKGCKIVSKGHKFPNGLIREWHTGLIHVPSSVAGGIQVYRSLPDMGLELVGNIPIPYPIDNLSQDENGDIWVPALPKI